MLNEKEIEIEKEIEEREIEVDQEFVVSYGASDYNTLNNKPTINGIILEGNKTTEELGVVPYDDTEIRQELNDTYNKIEDINNNISEINDNISGINEDISDIEDNKADKTDIPIVDESLSATSNNAVKNSSIYEGIQTAKSEAISTADTNANAMVGSAVSSMTQAIGAAYNNAKKYTDDQIKICEENINGLSIRVESLENSIGTINNELATLTSVEEE